MKKISVLLLLALLIILKIENFAHAASFSVTKYSITPIAASNGSISPSTVQSVNSGGTVAFTAKANTGYQISGWQVGAQSYAPCAKLAVCQLTNILKNTNIQALFSILSYSITPVAGTNGSIAPKNAQPVNYGGSLTFTASPSNGYVVSGWKFGGTNYSSCAQQTSCTIYNITQSTTIEAVFTTQYTLSPVAGVGGSILPNTAQVLPAGTSQSFTATPNTGYQIDKWLLGTSVISGCGSNSTCTLSNISSSNQVGVNFKLHPQTLYSVFVGSGPNGSVSPSGLHNDLSLGASPIYQATPDSGYQVSQWVLDDVVVQTKGSSYTLSGIAADHSIYVYFTPTKGLYLGTQSGHIYSSTDNGFSWSLLSSPAVSSPVNAIYYSGSKLYAGTASGFLYSSSSGGLNWVQLKTFDGSAITSIFVSASSVIYVGTTAGHFYSSIDGVKWSSLTVPEPVNAFYIDSANIFYFGSSKGNIYYSANSGKTWLKIAGPDGTAIKNLYVTLNGVLYANTAQRFLYTLPSKSSTSWSLNSQIVFSMFVNSDASKIYVGSSGGSVYSLTDGTELGYIENSAINSIFSY